jgi:hypothetical protein
MEKVIIITTLYGYNKQLVVDLDTVTKCWEKPGHIFDVYDLLNDLSYGFSGHQIQGLILDGQVLR